MNKSKIKEKIVSNRGYAVTKFVLKLFVVPLSIIIAFLTFRFFKFFYKLSHLSKKTPKSPTKNFNFKYEKINFKNETPLSLEGWFIRAQEKPFFGKAPTIILCHGFPGSKEEVLNQAKFLIPHYNVFLFDFRALGKSKGICSSIGFYEQKDLISAINYLKKRPEVDENKIGLFGFSMGASVSLMVAAKFPELKAIVVDSPYASLDDVFDYIIKESSFFYKVFIMIFIIIRKFLVRLNPNEISPLTAVRDINIPIFIIHSRDDKSVPFKDSKLIFEAANEPKSFWAPTGSRHGEIINDYPEEYKKRVKDFFDKYLK